MTDEDNTTYHLTDRQLAATICALQVERDRLIKVGLTGDDCQSALDALYRGMTPATNGLTYRLGQHERLFSGRRIVHGDDDAE